MMQKALLLIATFQISSIFANQTVVESPSHTLALKGSDVLLKCTVQQQSGAVQWTKNGFGLGTDRNLVVFQRYDMVGSSSEY